MTRDWCSSTQGGIRISVQITPNAKKSEVIGVLDDALKIRLQAQPIEGKANDALVRFLADMLSVPKSAVTITHGHTNKRKMIEVTAPGITIERVRNALTGEGA
ncbi:DUF167 domain-containing protein [Noviherbaspirillum denitrificans]|uniref:UPF0235 protein AYR66_05605 n=1 Tax=Noviherbaspirillum denitrificans TaxID=1968433 RepID=A0A254TA58_9BURK|nr:DUF167 domain-containing protein [Noviherbaspirillum denitrificans]OWW19047.1 hypothetical protein AYR66_05605 [Noviherbaspirillum denitrificans]